MIEHGVLVSVAVLAATTLVFAGRALQRIDTLERDHKDFREEVRRRFDTVEGIMIGRRRGTTGSDAVLDFPGGEGA